MGISSQDQAHHRKGRVDLNRAQPGEAPSPEHGANSTDPLFHSDLSLANLGDISPAWQQQREGFTLARTSGCSQPL